MHLTKSCSLKSTNFIFFLSLYIHIHCKDDKSCHIVTSPHNATDTVVYADLNLNTHNIPIPRVLPDDI